ncbi:DUF4231 domain-containing protein [Nocardia asteroides]|uniref:DUF4231 domain-containing protein n=1 Tax=Nocardia asteroides TaxID=1824 RepID=UPI001E2F21EA|nr:DUF4231 domain-containing protein [Nocardia asteroides]UGT59857.1 DUF4231 domain-containing protein [Nocardia asteroides]
MKPETTSYAEGVASASYYWYKKAAIKARRLHRVSELSQLILSAAIPVCAVILEGNTILSAVLGSLLVVITGLKSSFHWHDDYLRFSQAREAVEAERRLYATGSEPYDDVSKRDQVLVKILTSIEQREMGFWLRKAKSRKAAADSP